MYEISFLKLSDRHYKASPWPEVQHIQEVVDQDHVFCLLYKVCGVLAMRRAPTGADDVPAPLPAVTGFWSGQYSPGGIAAFLQEMYFRHLYARCQPTLRDR